MCKHGHAAGTAWRHTLVYQLGDIIGGRREERCDSVTRSSVTRSSLAGNNTQQCKR